MRPVPLGLPSWLTVRGHLESKIPAEWLSAIKQNPRVNQKHFAQTLPDGPCGARCATSRITFVAGVAWNARGKAGAVHLNRRIRSVRERFDRFVHQWDESGKAA